MSRWSRRNAGLTKSKDDRSSFGEANMEAALGALNMAQQRAASVLTHLHASREGVIHMLIPDETYDKLRAVYGIVENPGNTAHYNVDDGKLGIDFAGGSIYPFQPRAMKMQEDRIEPLRTFLRELAAVHWAYEEVRGTLKWLNRNATPGAIRYYWPSAMKLVPDAPIWADLVNVPTRFTNPIGVGDWLQIFKDTATTVSAMAMLPNDASPRVRNTMWVTFNQKRIDVGIGNYTTDAITYNI